MTFLFMAWIRLPRKIWNQNRDALEELFTAIMSTGVKHTNPTHGTLAGAIADEKLIPSLSKITNAGPDNLTGISMWFGNWKH